MLLLHMLVNRFPLHKKVYTYVILYVQYSDFNTNSCLCYSFVRKAHIFEKVCDVGTKNKLNLTDRKSVNKVFL